jgi:hypothetical protein
MANLTITQKAARCLRLILGMRHPEVAEALAPFGFSAETLEEGWRLMSALTAPRAAVPADPPRSPALVPQVDRFENTWFPIARGVLQHRYPQAAERLFAGISQTRGHDACLSVMTFLDRLDQMETGERPFGDIGPAAREALRERGLTEERLVEVRALLDQIATLEPPRTSQRLVALEEEDRAVEALWGWYLEWSVVARRAVKNRTLLRSLGFSPRLSAQPEPGRPPRASLRRRRSSRCRQRRQLPSCRSPRTTPSDRVNARRATRSPHAAARPWLAAVVFCGGRATRATSSGPSPRGSDRPGA